jgi:RNA polymerase sigma-70 factor, ECF subfamily
MEPGRSRNKSDTLTEAAMAQAPAARLPAQGSDPAPSQADLGALEACYREYHSFVWRSLFRLGVPRQVLDDAVHDTFLVVARRLGEFEGRASMRTWLFAIAMRVAQSVYRDRARELRNVGALSAVADAASAASHGAARSDAALELQRLLATLDEDKRAVFIMSELEQMTAPEIAVTLGVKLPTVYSRLRLAKAELERSVKRQARSEEP